MVEKVISYSLGLIIWLALVVTCKQLPRKPNFVVVVADDLGWDDVGFHGSPEVKTPNMDKLASDGVILNDYYVQPICTPTRSALLTGKYPIRNGMQSSVIMTSQAWGLGLEEKLLPEQLKDLGYKTHLVGKWHLGFFSKPYLPLRRGFDSHFGCYAGRGDFWDHSSEAGTFMGLDLRDGEKPVFNEWGNYTTEMFTDVAISRIMDHDEKHPLFLMVSHLAVHSANSKDPLQAPEEEQRMFEDVKHAQRKKYLAMVASLDKSIGRVYDSLKDAGILHNTVFIFTTDNGGASNGFDSNHGSNYPFRGMKTSLFEGGIRAAGFVNSPLIRKKKRVSRELIHVTDWYATILSLAGGEPDSNIDGKNIWDHVSHNKLSPRKELLMNIDDMVYMNSALREGKWKIVFQQPDEWNEWFNPPDYDRNQYDNLKRNPNLDDSSIKCDGKPAEAPDCTNGCLFNIRRDPCEFQDLSETKGEIFERLKQKLEQYRKEMVEPRYKHDEDPNSNPRNHGGIWSPWIEPEGDPVKHKPLAPGEKLPGQPPEHKPPDQDNQDTDQNQKPTEQPTTTAPAQEAPSQQAPSQQAPSQQAPSQQAPSQQAMMQQQQLAATNQQQPQQPSISKMMRTLKSPSLEEPINDVVDDDATEEFAQENNQDLDSSDQPLRGFFDFDYRPINKNTNFMMSFDSMYNDDRDSDIINDFDYR